MLLINTGTHFNLNSLIILKECCYKSFLLDKTDKISTQLTLLSTKTLDV